MEQTQETQARAAAPLVVLTEKAILMIKQTMLRKGRASSGLRLKVEGSGCRGFQYSLTLEAEAQPEDTVLVQGGVRAFLDPTSARHLQGTRLDYVSNRLGSGFHFFGLDGNRTIGCGSPVLLQRCMAGNTRTIGCENSAKRPLLDILAAAPTHGADYRASVAHPGLRPRQICPECRYVVCRCEKTA